ncbi:hypothetical protein NQ318_016918 [Aromia moschata]|uniref:Uncharacterized protein n=1 Tax=Aromia moschata TaxID=1265417 RepID=A0AAV8XI04_9CUCU|nr:hypothetical protein NQ318_016918 [Aromia moschata]
MTYFNLQENQGVPEAVQQLGPEGPHVAAHVDPVEQQGAARREGLHAEAAGHARLHPLDKEEVEEGRQRHPPSMPGLYMPNGNNQIILDDSHNYIELYDSPNESNSSLSRNARNQQAGNPLRVTSLIDSFEQDYSYKVGSPRARQHASFNPAPRANMYGAAVRKGPYTVDEGAVGHVCYRRFSETEGRYRALAALCVCLMRLTVREYMYVVTVVLPLNGFTVSFLYSRKDYGGVPQSRLSIRSDASEVRSIEKYIEGS